MKFHSESITEHAEVPLADSGRFEQIVDVWQQSHGQASIDKQNQLYPNEGKEQGKEQDKGNRCYVLTVCFAGQTDGDGKEAEIIGLVNNLGDTVVGQRQYLLHQPNPKTLLGRGVLQQISATARESGANLLVIDAPLSPSQTRNIEQLTGMSISDREGVILNVFLRHAKTRSAKVQVELAQLEYLRPRIRGLGINMDQQAGGIGAGKGPGETASELLARQIDGRITQLQQAAKKLNAQQQNQRKGRVGCSQIALLGYTNAGKTSLMNTLCDSQLSAKDAPFETLDTTTRVLKRSAASTVLLSDTVGFIRQLPQRLLASFESTIAQAVEADLLVIVVDVSDPEHLIHLATTVDMLEKLGIADLPQFYVFNKVDKLEFPLLEQDCVAMSNGHEYQRICSYNKEQVGQLQQQLIAKVSASHVTETIYVAHDDGPLMAKIYSKTQVLSVDADEAGCTFTVKAEGSVIAQLLGQQAV